MVKIFALVQKALVLVPEAVFEHPIHPNAFLVFWPMLKTIPFPWAGQHWIGAKPYPDMTVLGKIYSAIHMPVNPSPKDGRPQISNRTADAA